MPSLAGRAARLVGLDQADLIAWSVRWRSVFPHRGFREHQRVPLWHPDVPFVLITSQKAGSTFGTSWFFRHAGLLSKARAHHPFVHRFEQEVFLRQPGYFRGLEAALGTRKVIKLVRDPGARAFSSYLALCTTEVLDNPRDHRIAIRRRIAESQGIGRDARAPISLTHFLAWVAGQDHRRLDGHEARQANLYEDRLPQGRPEALHLEEVHTDIPRLESRLGLPETPAEELGRLGVSGHHVSKVEDDPQTVRQIIEHGVELPRKGRQPRITSATFALFPEARGYLFRAYGKDYDRYGYILPKAGGS